MWGYVLGIAASVVVILGGLATAVGWLIRNYLKELIENTKELKPNGGSSMNDTITKKILPAIERMEGQIQQLAVDNAGLEGRFSQYVEDHKE